MEEHSWSRVKAAMIGTREIALAVLATTLSLVVIFLPLAVLCRVGSGDLLQLRDHRGLGDHGVAVYLVTLTPMLASRFLRHSKDDKSARRKRMRPIFAMAFPRAIWWSLAGVLRHRWAVILATAACVGSLYFLLR